MTQLTIATLCSEAAIFSEAEGRHSESTLFGASDGKAVGTYLEHKFRAHLRERGYDFQDGNSASGIDFPGLGVDIKTTSARRPQSSSPFESARQKIYGLGYSLIIFVYDKINDDASGAATLKIIDTVFVEAAQTGDFQITAGLREILDRDGNRDDVAAFLSEKSLPVDEIGLDKLATEIMGNRPLQGYLTISHAPQWRLKYARAIEKAGAADGIRAVYRGGS